MGLTARDRVAFAGAVLAAVAAAWLAHLLVLPGLVGFINDDAQYALTGRAIADGLGYVNPGYPGHPPATRYPIGFPALVALVLAGTHDLADQLARLQWVGPLTAAAFVLVSFLAFRRWNPGQTLLALGATLVVTLHPTVASMGATLMSDLLYGAVALAALLYAERAFASPAGFGKALRVGAALGLSILVRYAGVALVVAVLLALALKRRWREIGGILCGVGLVLAPWLLYRVWTGGETYLAEYGRHVVGTFADVRTVAGYLLTNAPPGLLAPWIFKGWTAPLLGVGALVDAAVVLGALRWARGSEEAPLAPTYLAVSVAVACVWQLAYMELEDWLFVRLLVPVFPLMLQALMASVRGRAGGPILAGLLAVTIAGNGWLLADQLRYFQGVTAVTLAKGDYPRTFDAVRTYVPADAVMIGWKAGMTSFYTGRECIQMPTGIDAPGLRAFMRQHGIRYILGTPTLTIQSTGAAFDPRGHVRHGDAAVALLNDYMRRYPGELDAVWINPSKQFVIFEVRQPGRKQP